MVRVGGSRPSQRTRKNGAPAACYSRSIYHRSGYEFHRFTLGVSRIQVFLYLPAATAIKDYVGYRTTHFCLHSTHSKQSQGPLSFVLRTALITSPCARQFCSKPATT